MSTCQGPNCFPNGFCGVNEEMCFHVILRKNTSPYFKDKRGDTKVIGETTSAYICYNRGEGK